KRTSLKQKIWAYKRGFLSSRILDYGINNDNFQSYLSDIDYYKMFPMNGKYAYWINDKLTTKYILEEYGEYLPDYFYTIKNGEILPSINAPLRDNLDSDAII